MTVFRHGDMLHLVFNLLLADYSGAFYGAQSAGLAYVGFLAAAAVVGSATEIADIRVNGHRGVRRCLRHDGIDVGGPGTLPGMAGGGDKRQSASVCCCGAYSASARHMFHLLSIANGAHGGGLVFGRLSGGCCSRRGVSGRGRRAGGIANIRRAGLFWMPWSDGWTYWKAGQEMDRSHYQSAIGWYHHNLARGGDAHSDWRNIGLAWEGLSAQETDRHNANGAKAASLEATKAYQIAGPEAPDTP